MQQFFTNRSCDPFTDKSSPCELGNYVSYAVDVSTSDDVVAAIQFAQDNNIRFVIKNTGHEYVFCLLENAPANNPATSVDQPAPGLCPSGPIS